MKREDKVVSLELAKQIDDEHKRLGIAVEREWWWVDCDIPLHFDSKFKFGFDPKGKKGKMGWHLRDKGERQHLVVLPTITNLESFPAYDTAELGEMLPDTLKKSTGTRFKIHMGRNSLETQWVISYKPIYSSCGCLQTTFAKTEAEARGKMYLWLLQNGYIVNAMEGKK